MRHAGCRESHIRRRLCATAPAPRPVHWHVLRHPRLLLLVPKKAARLTTLQRARRTHRTATAQPRLAAQPQPTAPMQPQPPLAPQPATAAPPACTPPARTPPAATHKSATPPTRTPPAWTAPAWTPPAWTPPAWTPPAWTPPTRTPPAWTPPTRTPPAWTPLAATHRSVVSSSSNAGPLHGDMRATSSCACHHAASCFVRFNSACSRSSSASDPAPAPPLRAH